MSLLGRSGFEGVGWGVVPLEVGGLGVSEVEGMLKEGAAGLRGDGWAGVVLSAIVRNRDSVCVFYRGCSSFVRQPPSSRSTSRSKKL